VLQYLVKELGFTAFAIEATWPESNAVNAYVSGGPGDPAVLLSNLYFWTWNTQEVLDMIRWMRAYNATVAPERRVRFSGFDMQYPGAAIDSVFTYVGRVDPPQAPAVDSAYDCLASYRNRGAQQATRVYAADVTGAARARCAAAVARPYALLAAGRERYEAATSADAFARALQSARLVVQWEDMAAQTSAAAGSLARDRYMAENVGWLLDQLPAGSRMMLWAHNGHVMRAPTAMGGRLAARYGADYVAAGFAFGTGSFNARPALADGSLGAVARQSVSDVVPGTLESYAAATGVPRFLVDMRAVATTPAASPLAGPIPMRSIGAGYSASAASAYYAPTLFPADYDLLIYFDTATASTLLPFRFF
jgi:erythromycin esterase